VKGNVLRLSLLRSPEWPDPTADRGKHTIEYSLYPHQGRLQQSNTIQRGYEFNNPLLATIGTIHKGKLPLAYSFVQLQPANLVLTSIKKAEDSNAWIIQWYESQGIDSDAQLTLPQQPENVVESNFLEEDGAPISFLKNTIKVKTEKNSITTIKVTY
jgi:alpha-mannosidase